MKNSALADWLDHCLEYINLTEEPLGPAIFEGVLQVAATGQMRMLESILEGAIRNTLALNKDLEPVTHALSTIKLILWTRLEGEVEPDAVWDMLLGLELIFQAATNFATETYIVMLQDNQQSQLMAVTRQHQQAEQKVMNYAADVSRANRELARLEQAKTDFLSIAAHELKTPLSVVQGYVNMLLEGGPAKFVDLAETVLEGIATGTARLTELVDNMIDITALDTNTLVLKQEPVMLGQLTKMTVERIKKQSVSREQHLHYRIEPDLPAIHTDSSRVYQVLFQLINNAVKYTPDGGEIAVRVYLEQVGEIDEPASTAHFIKVEVADSGIGIAPEDREQIFRKFYRVADASLHSTGKTKFKGAGPGLGLPLTKGIVEAIGGQIWVESPGYDETHTPGSTFHVRFPVELEAEAEAEAENLGDTQGDASPA